MRLVNKAKDHSALRSIFGSQLAPQICKLIVRWATLADDASVPSGVIVDVNDTVAASSQAPLNKHVVLRKVGGIKRCTRAVDKELPCYR